LTEDRTGEWCFRRGLLLGCQGASLLLMKGCGGRDSSRVMEAGDQSGIVREVALRVYLTMEMEDVRRGLPWIEHDEVALTLPEKPFAGKQIMDLEGMFLGHAK